MDQQDEHGRTLTRLRVEQAWIHKPLVAATVWKLIIIAEMLRAAKGGLKCWGDFGGQYGKRHDTAFVLWKFFPRVDQLCRLASRSMSSNWRLLCKVNSSSGPSIYKVKHTLAAESGGLTKFYWFSGGYRPKMSNPANRIYSLVGRDVLLDLGLVWRCSNIEMTWLKFSSTGWTFLGFASNLTHITVHNCCIILVSKAWV